MADRKAKSVHTAHTKTPAAEADLKSKATLGTVIGSAWANILKHKVSWVILGLLSLLPQILAILGGKGVSAANSTIVPTAGLFVFGGGLLILFLAYSLVAYTAQVSSSLKLIGQDKDVSLGEAIQLGVSNVVPLLWTSIVLISLVIVGLFLLIVPGLVFAVLFGFAPYVAIDQKLTAFDAMTASKDMVKNNLGLVISASFVILLCYVVATIIARIFGVTNDTTVTSDPTMLAEIVVAIMNAAVGVFAMAVGARLYFALKDRA